MARAAVVLVVASGLLIRSFRDLMRVDAGFDAANVLTAVTQLPSERNDHAEQRRFAVRPLSGAEAVTHEAKQRARGEIPASEDVSKAA